MEQMEKTIAIDNIHIANVFGQFDTNIKQIEKELYVRIINRGEEVKILGYSNNIDKAIDFLEFFISPSSLFF